ncbi:MAG: zinc ribbon domain-containing protein [Gammaproteobacteria bacterium]
MHCGHCSAELEPEAKFCGVCGNQVGKKLPGGTGNEKPIHPAADAQSREGTGRDSRSVVGESVQTHTGYISTYKTGRQISAVISFAGWLVVASGVIAFFAVSQEFGNMPGKLLIPITTGVLIGMFGLGFVALGQYLRAAFDTADFTGEMLALMKANKK